MLRERVIHLHVHAYDCKAVNMYMYMEGASLYNGKDRSLDSADQDHS